jgi:hypothetical protein
MAKKQVAEEHTPNIPVTVGDLVHYVLPDGVHLGDRRAAVVVRVLGDGAVNLQVFMDGDADGGQYPGGLRWVGNVQEGELPGNWQRASL